MDERLNMKYTVEQIEELKMTVFNFYKTITEMNQKYDRKFTMDGHMIGSVGEVFASYYYGMELYESGHKLYDGKKGDKEIQIKITQRDSVEVKGVPAYLIVLKIEFTKSSIEVFEVYNGPGEIALPKKKHDDYKESSLSINKLSKIIVDAKDVIEVNHELAKWKN